MDKHVERSNVAAYENRFVPIAYDVLVASIFTPFGGVTRLRMKAIDLIGVSNGMRVLEPGCGTGGVTKLLVARGADVTAVDGSEQMLSRARRRAPGARFEKQQLETLDAAGTFDLVLFSFVLHELPRGLRAQALAAGVRSLVPNGRIAVLDHAVPGSGRFAQAWRGFLMKLEPPSVAECIERGYDTELEAAGMRVTAHYALAGGTAALTIAERE
ncbi:MAG TPA: methyltransferase domain-containing protein [Parvibaculum sp.]|jgi:ubiquinone/menaquinone biosynthesis C-methylase UbiE